MYGIRSLQNGGAPKKLGKAEKYIPPELRPQAGALVDLIKWIKSNPYRAARDVAESFGPQADIKGMVDSSQSAMENLREGNIGAGLTDMAYVPANMATLFLPGSASGMRRAAEGLGGGVGKKADDLPVDEASRSLLRRVRTEGGGSEGISAIFEETGDPYNSLADIYGLDTIRPEEVSFVRDELTRITRDSLADLPDMITVYRGGNIRGELVPVTTSRDTARFFAERSGEPMREFQIPKDAVVANVEAILGPNASFLEKELLVRPSALRLPTDEASSMARAQKMTKKSAGERAQEAIRGQADLIEQVAKESYASE